MNLLDNLNAQQREAVTAPAGPVLVLAGPGSGKTRVLTHRIAYQISQLGIPPAAIMAVTFTNKAAREMGNRVEELLTNSVHQSNMGTFHAFSAGVVRREANLLPVTREFVIFDDADQLSIMRKILKDMNIDPKQSPPRRIQNIISAAKNELIEAPDFAANNYFNEIVRRVYELYQQKLLDNNALDFDDLLLYAVKVLRENQSVLEAYRRRYRTILVDEFQDTNTAQYTLLRLIAGENPDLFAVGDPDQSIYRWRGADYRNVLRFLEDFPGAQTILLEQNYRSTQNILDLGMAVIDKHPGRQRKALFTDRGAGELIKFHEAYDEQDEANFVLDQIQSIADDGGYDLGDMAVMYRTNAQSRILEEAFLRAGQPYRLVGAQRFYGRREVKDLVGYLRLIHNREDQVSLLRVINTPPRGIGGKTISSFLQAAEDAHVSPATILDQLATDPNAALFDRFPRRGGQALAEFGKHLKQWRAMSSEIELGNLIDRILQDTHYHAYLDDGSEEGAERWENLLELRSLAQEFTELGMSIFLEHIALISDQDTLTDGQSAPTLLTLHAAKGLEFPIVIIIGLDDGLIPHQRSFDEPEAMLEERRLFYVGITRAKDRLVLVRCFRRRFFGTSSTAEPSRYLNDLPADLLEGDVAGILTREQSAYNRQTDWNLQPMRESVESKFNVGMRVKHAKFGEGIVMDSRVDQDDEEVTVEFEEYGIKILAASVANLERNGD
ncbi:MAG: UvrD-helicase domain-containing protein [Chloroflexi bacterium]|nr:UvrD-helicase domain-containing protein [Chloroflexota bacterium]